MFGTHFSSLVLWSCPHAHASVYTCVLGPYSFSESGKYLGANHTHTHTRSCARGRSEYVSCNVCMCACTCVRVYVCVSLFSLWCSTQRLRLDHHSRASEYTQCTHALTPTIHVRVSIHPRTHALSLTLSSLSLTHTGPPFTCASEYSHMHTLSLICMTLDTMCE